MDGDYLSRWGATLELGELSDQARHEARRP
jgi:hypothetical protein